MLWVISFDAIRLRLEGLGARVVRGAEVTPNKLQTNKLTCQHMSYVMTLLDIYNLFTLTKFLDQQFYTQKHWIMPKNSPKKYNYVFVGVQSRKNDTRQT